MAKRKAKTTVVLLARQRAALDRFAIDVRERTGRPIDRGGLIRAAVAALLAAKIDPASVTSEAALAAALRARAKA